MKLIQDIRTVGYLYYDIDRAKKHEFEMQEKGFTKVREWHEGKRIKYWYIKEEK